MTINLPNKSPGPKRQGNQRRFHTVPAGYLAGFAQPCVRDGVLLAFDLETDRQRETIPDHEAFRTDYYRLAGEGPDTLTVEQILTEADTNLGRLIRQIEEKERLPPTHHLDSLLEALALLVTRNPKFGDGADLVFGGIMGLIGLLSGEPGLRRKACKGPFAGTFRACLSAVSSVPVHCDFAKRTWSLVIAKPGVGEFVTSDAPASVETRRGPGWMLGGALDQQESRVVVPLSPRLAMIGSLGGRRRIRRVGYVTVAAVNGTTVRSARRFVYARSREFWWWDVDGWIRGPEGLQLAHVQSRLAS